MWCHYDYLSAPNRDGASPNSNRKYQTCRSTQITGCCVLLQLKLGSHKHDMKAENVLGYCRNLGSLRYRTSTASCLKTLWEKPFFLLTEALFNHAVKLHSHLFVPCVKNELYHRLLSWGLLSGAASYHCTCCTHGTTAKFLDYYA